MKKMGSHVSFATKGLLGATNQAVSYGANTFMIYTGAPQNTRRKEIDQLYIPEGKLAMKKANIPEIVVHAPYIINLASYKENIYRLAVEFLKKEIHRTHAIGAVNIVLHPGSFTDKDPEYGIARISKGLNEVLEGTHETDVSIALETMAGKGTELGSSFEQMGQIIDQVGQKNRLTVTFDTCHVHDAGYDLVNNLDDVLAEFDRFIGLDRLQVVHLNDSKNPRGARKDRHSPIGTGFIGFEAIANLVNHKKLKDRPFLLETPWIGEPLHPLYEIEISLLQNNVKSRFGESFLADVVQLHHFFAKKELDGRSFILKTWQQLKNDAFLRKQDPREPLQRLRDLVRENKALPESYSELELNYRLLAFLAGQKWLNQAFN